MRGLNGMTQRQSVVHRVVIATSILDDGEKTAVDEFSHNALNRPFRDANCQGEVAYAQIRGAGQADQHVRMVREEGPGGWWELSCWASHTLMLAYA